VADGLGASLVGGGGGFGEPGAPASLRRVSMHAEVAGRRDTVEEVTRLLAASTRLPLAVCGPDAAAVVAAAAGKPVVLVDARDAAGPGVMSDATLACALEGALLCLDGLADLDPPGRERLLRTIDERPSRTVLVARSRGEAAVLNDRTALIVEVPIPSFAERRAAPGPFPPPPPPSHP